VELRQLEQFLAVVEEGSFTGAAARLYAAQSSLSASLLGLERELGAQLFIRGRRGAELTDAGRALLGPARAAIEEAGRARDAVAEVSGLLQGVVRVATVVVPTRVDVVETVRMFQARYPGVRVHVRYDGASDLAAFLAQGQVDFAITPLTRRTRPAVRFEPLLGTPLAVVCPAEHRLAGARDVDVRELLDEPIIDFPRGWSIRDLFDRLVEGREQRREVRLEVNEWFGVLAMVQRGVGISYGPRACLEDADVADMAIVTLADAPLWELGLATRDEAPRGAAGRAFLDAYRRQVRDLASG
jgi:DNA-binding transcriptional LysR family regulator